MSERPESSIEQSSERTAELVRTISSAGGISVRALMGGNLIAEAMDRRPMAGTAANALGRALMGAVLISVGAAETENHDPDNDETLQLQFRGDGPLGRIVVIADTLGHVRGMVTNPSVELTLSDGSPDVARAIGMGTLRVVRHRLSWREPYTGIVPLTSGEIAQDLTLYLTESEQTPSAMGLGVAVAKDQSAVAAVGFLVQLLPGASDEEIAQVEENVRNMPPLSQLALSDTSGDELIDFLLSGLGSRARHTSEAVFRCTCTRERALRTLQLLGEVELGQIVRGGDSQEVRCEFCATTHDFSPSEIRSLLPS